MAPSVSVGAVETRLAGVESSAEGLARGVSRNTGKFVGDAAARNRRFERRGAAARLATWIFKNSDEKSSFDSVASCGKALGSLVSIKSDGVSAWASGVRSCGSVWSCPVCSRTVKTRRAVELSAAAARHVELGGNLSMMTLTVRHDASMSLVKVRRGVGESYRKLQSLTSYRRLARLMLGRVTATEVTLGQNGWHPHLHVLLFLREGVSEAELEAAVSAVRDDWLSLVDGILGVRPSLERGVHVLHFGSDVAAVAAGYISKVAKELTASDLKSGRDPFVLLDGVMEGDARSVAKWVEFCDAMKGKQSLSWSKGLRALLGLGRQLSDEEIAAADEEVGEVVATVPARIWNRALREGSAWVFLSDVERSLRVAAVGHVT